MMRMCYSAIFYKTPRNVQQTTSTIKRGFVVTNITKDHLKRGFVVTNITIDHLKWSSHIKYPSLFCKTFSKLDMPC